MSYNIARRIARGSKIKGRAKSCPSGTYFVADIIQPAGGPTSLVPYSIGPGDTLVDESAVTAAARLDKAWFESHPDRSHRIRHALAGEIPGMTVEGYVVVRQVEPGFRLRQAFTTAVTLPEDEAPEHIAHAFYDLADEFRGGTVPEHEIAKRIYSYGSGIDIGDPTSDTPPTVH